MRCAARLIACIVVALVLRLGPGLEAAQLPPEILVDRALTQAARFMDDQDYTAALEALDEVVALQRQHGLALPDPFHFQYARWHFPRVHFKWLWTR